LPNPFPLLYPFSKLLIKCNSKVWEETTLLCGDLRTGGYSDVFCVPSVEHLDLKSVWMCVCVFIRPRVGGLSIDPPLSLAPSCGLKVMWQGSKEALIRLQLIRCLSLSLFRRYHPYHCCFQPLSPSFFSCWTPGLLLSHSVTFYFNPTWI